MEKTLIFVYITCLIGSINGQQYIRNENRATKDIQAEPKPFDLIMDESHNSRRFSSRPLKKRKTKFPDDSIEDFSETYEDEEDNNSYSVGTHIRVTHPSPQPYRKPKNEAVSYVRQEPDIPVLPTYKKKKILVSKKPQFVQFNEDFEDSEESGQQSSSESYETIDTEPRKFHNSNYKLHKAPNTYSQQESAFKGVASKKQIEKFLEDQQRIIDETIKLQLLNDPSPHAIGKYHQFLKAKDDERIEKEVEQELKKKPIFRPNNNVRRPRKGEGKRLGKKSPPLPPAPPHQGGLGNFRSGSPQRHPRGSNRIRFNIEV